MLKRFRPSAFLFSLLMPLSAIASTHDFFQLFTPNAGDLSVKYLGELFGTVGGVLKGAGGQALGQLFGIFNSGILILAGLFLIYTVITTVTHTAEDGQAMGRDKSTTWVALKSALGIVFLIPSQATGYSLVQVVMMWIVLQGVGLANQAWERAIDYLSAEGGILYVSAPTSIQSADSALKPAEAILRSEICMYKTKTLLAKRDKSLAATQAANNGSTALRPMIEATPSVGYDINATTQTVNFGSKSKNGGYNSECGSVGWAGIGKGDPKQAQYLQAGVQQMVIDLSSVAKHIADSNMTDAIKNQAAQSLVTAVKSYVNIITPAMAKETSNAQQTIAAGLETAKQQGWVLAGSYYRHLIQLNTEIKEDFANFVPKAVKQVPTADEKLAKNPDGSSNVLALIDKSIVLNAVNSADVGQQAQTLLKNTSSSDNAIKGPLQDQRSTIAKWIWGSATPMAVLSLAGGPHLSLIILSAAGLLQGVADLWMKSMSSSLDPILNLHQLGSGLLTAATSVWLVVTGLLFLGTLAYGLIPFVKGPAPAVQNAVEWFTGVLSGLLAALFGMGLVLSVYIPLIPYIIFAFAALGWFIAVIEAMLAAPLIALGVTHPYRQDLLGQVEQSVMLILSVFLRPVLLIIGLIAGLILARIAVKFINEGFAVIVGGTSAGGDLIAGITSLFSIIGLMAIYTMLMIYVVNTCFNMIPLVAERVMRWLGLHAEHAGYEHELEAIKGAVEQGGEMAGGALARTDQSLGISAKEGRSHLLDKEDTLGAKLKEYKAKKSKNS